MDKRKQRDAIQHALNSTLSGLQDDPWLTQRVIVQAKGEKKVKRKISIGFIFAVILILAAMTALAIGLTGYFSGFAALENTYGEYEEWPASAKVELVKLMLESDLFLAEDVAQWGHAQSVQEQETAAKALLDRYFSDLIYVDTYNVMTNELGPVDSWPQEYKVLYSSALIQYGQQKDDWPIYIFPDSEDIQQDEAISLARNALREKFGLNGELDAATVNATFLISPMEYGNTPVWIVEFSDPDRFRHAYRVVLDQDGNLILYAAPNTPEYTENTNDIAQSETMPSSYDASEEEILHAAQDKYGFSGIDGVRLEAQFVYDERYNAGYEPVWIVLFTSEDGKPVYQMLFTYDGQYMDGVPAGQEFQNTYNYYEVTEEQFDYGFKDYSVEQRAAFSKQWKQTVDEFALSHPYYKNHNSLWYQATRCMYGIPSAQDISQDEAKAIAQAHIVSLGAQQSNVQDRQVTFAFDITQDPVWKVMLFGVEGSKETRTDLMTYQVIIDAKTGRVIASYNNAEDSLSAYNF